MMFLPAAVMQPLIYLGGQVRKIEGVDQVVDFRYLDLEVVGYKL